MELISKIGGTILVVGMILAVWKSETYLAKSLQKSRDGHEIAKDEPQTCEECEHWSDTEDGCADRHGCTITDCAWK